MEDMVRGRSDVELRLQIMDMGEANVHGAWFEKYSREPRVRFQVRAPNGMKVGTSFQNGLELRLGIEAVDIGQKHQPRLGHSKMVGKFDAG